MSSKKEGTLYLLILILTPIIVYYILAGDMVLTYQRGGTLGICFLSVLSGPIMFYVVYKVREKFFSKNIEFEDINKEDHSVETRSKKGHTRGIFSSKNKCETCDTETEYKKDMDSYYCPECREYK